MQLVYQSSDPGTYLTELEAIDYSHPAVAEQAERLRLVGGETTLDYIRTAYHFVRDEIHHSMDIQSTNVTCKASEVLEAREGICYAKSHLLAALLRAQGVPAGFCYQRLLLGETVEEGHCIHGLNAVYIEDQERWIRLDARGNKPGVQAEFCLDGEQLAFPVRPELGEIDYPVIYAQPHDSVLKVLHEQTNCIEMCKYALPGEI